MNSKKCKSPPERLDQDRAPLCGTGSAHGVWHAARARPSSAPAATMRNFEPGGEIAAEVKSAREEMAGLAEMLADPEMKAMAEDELAQIKATLPDLETPPRHRAAAA